MSVCVKIVIKIEIEKKIIIVFFGPYRTPLLSTAAFFRFNNGLWSVIILNGAPDKKSCLKCRSDHTTAQSSRSYVDHLCDSPRSRPGPDLVQVLFIWEQILAGYNMTQVGHFTASKMTFVNLQFQTC